MKTGHLRAAAAALSLVLASGAAWAADAPDGGVRPYRSARPVLSVATYSPLGPACQEHAPYDANLLRCRQQIQVRPPEDDVLAWNDLVRIKPQRKPYRELFSWSN